MSTVDSERPTPQAVTDSLKTLLRYIGEDPEREGLRETPERILRSWKELFAGYTQQPGDIVKVFLDGACDEMVVLKHIEFYSHCEHHWLPFWGTVSIGYLPQQKVIGVSKLARLVEMYARRLQIQERLTTQIADTLMEILDPKGVMVFCEAQHLCMTARGVQKQQSRMVTSAIRGIFATDEQSKQEFLELIKF